MTSPTVSVVMCTYNGAAFAEEQVLSIIHQDYPLFELIIQDDRSTDGTWEILENLANRYPLIRLFRNEINLGYNKNFESAMKHAQGDFVALSDQDDIWLPQKISRSMEAFASDEVILVHNRSVRLENGNLDFHKARLQHHFTGNDTRRLFLFNQIMGHDMIFRRRLLPHITTIPAGMSYDWWIAVTATTLGKVANVEEYLVHHRIHGNNNFFSNNAPSKKKELDLPDTLSIFLSIPTLSPDSRAYLEQFIKLIKEQTKEGDVRFNPALFAFLVKNRTIIFGHKRRALPLLSHIKNAVKYAKLNFKGKGMSI